MVGADGKVTVRLVKIIRDDGNVVRVTGALNTGDAVIDSPPDAIHNGQNVHVTQVLPAVTAAKAGACAK